MDRSTSLSTVVDWGAYSSWNLWMAQYTCSWISGACNGYLAKKTISQFSQWKSSTTMKSYWVNYVNDEYQNILSGIILSHQLVNGVIPSATFCQWSYQLKGGVNTKLSLTRKLNGFDMLLLQVIGTNGEVSTLSDSSMNSAQMDIYVSSALNFAYDKLVVQAVYLQDSYSSQYSITITEDSKSSDNTVIGIIVLLLISCTSVVVCTCWFVIIRAIIKGRAYRSFVRYQREYQEERQKNNENRLELLLIEIPIVSYDQSVVQFSQTNWIIWLENFISGAKVRVMPEWKHVFHVNWVDVWLKSKINEELRCAHWSIILKTQEEIAQLEQMKAEEK